MALGIETAQAELRTDHPGSFEGLLEIFETERKKIASRTVPYRVKIQRERVVSFYMLQDTEKACQTWWI